VRHKNGRHGCRRRRPAERYFVGYQTVTRFLSIEAVGERHARVRVDFNGDFGHEVGILGICVAKHGLIVRIDADLEERALNGSISKTRQGRRSALAKCADCSQSKESPESS
jgi:hypothetical protein